MSTDIPLNDLILTFLNEINQQIQGDQSAQVSMYEVGEVLGLEKDQASHIAEELISMGLIEIRTLSGGIGITAEGLSHVQASGQEASQGIELLSPGPIMNDADIALIESLLLQIKTRLGEMGLAYEALSELMVDLRTVDTQLLSPKPKTTIIKTCFESIGGTLPPAAPQDLRERVRSVAGGA